MERFESAIMARASQTLEGQRTGAVELQFDEARRPKRGCASRLY